MTSSVSPINANWPATTAGSDERKELPHEDCEVVAKRMDRLYNDAPLEAHERAALIFLYSAKFVNEAQKLWHHRAKKVDLMSGVACNDPWSDIMPDITQYPIERVASRIRKIESYVRYLELRYFENGPLSAHIVTAAPITAAQCDDIVLCARTGREILPSQSQNSPLWEGEVDPVLNYDPKSYDSYPFKLGFTIAEYNASMQRYILVRRAHFENGGTLDEWTDLENRAVLARIESELPVDSHEPEPL